MDIVEFAEKISGRKLYEHEKILIKFYSKLPKGAVLVMGRKGPMWLDKDGNVIDVSKFRDLYTSSYATK